MNDSAELQLAESGRAIGEWIRRVRSAADPAAQSRDLFPQLSQHLQQGNFALRSLLHQPSRSPQLESDIAEYGRALAELKSLLLQIETSLRIRAVILQQKRTRMQTLDSWASLARNLN